jgi:hypothetical protein
MARCAIQEAGRTIALVLLGSGGEEVGPCRKKLGHLGNMSLKGVWEPWPLPFFLSTALAMLPGHK